MFLAQRNDLLTILSVAQAEAAPITLTLSTTSASPLSDGRFEVTVNQAPPKLVTVVMEWVEKQNAADDLTWFVTASLSTKHAGLHVS